MKYSLAKSKINDSVSSYGMFDHWVLLVNNGKHTYCFELVKQYDANVSYNSWSMTFLDGKRKFDKIEYLCDCYVWNIEQIKQVCGNNRLNGMRYASVRNCQDWVRTVMQDLGLGRVIDKYFSDREKVGYSASILTLVTYGSLPLAFFIGVFTYMFR
jgi:hypothetical protein